MMIKKILFIIPVLFGISFFLFAMKSKKNPKTVEAGELATLARVHTIKEETIAPKVYGYGMALPEMVWKAVSEVKGKIIDKHPKLKNGNLIHKGEVLLKIDPIDYELKVDQTKQDIQNNIAQQQELEVNIANYKASLEIEKKSLAIDEKQFSRYTNLKNKKVISDFDLEKMEEELLKQRTSVQNLTNSLRLIPVKKAALEAQMKVLQAQLKTVQRELEHTVIKAPFDCRIADLQVEKNQYITIGQTLFSADSIHGTELEAQVATEKLMPILEGQDFKTGKIDLKATVRLKLGTKTIEWPAQFLRMKDGIDLETRTVGVIVRVDKPYENAVPGVQPPLVKGMYCELELQGKERSVLTVPREANHDNQLFLVDDESRLQKVPLNIDFSQPEFYVIKGVKPGSKVILSDLLYAFNGMKIKPLSQ